MKEINGPFEEGYIVSTGFSMYHRQLSDLAFKKTKIPSTVDLTLGSGEQRSLSEMITLSTMVKIEFVASMEQQIEKPADQEMVSDPKPFDVFLVNRPISRSPTGCIMIYVPMVKPRNELMWMDSDGGFWLDKPDFHIRPIASLTGPARVLENVSASISSDLKSYSMSRENLIDVVSEEEADMLLLNTDSVTHLNASQRVAIATLISGRFLEGFLVVQGPPGCGKTSTLVEMISITVEPCVVAAPSNAAVANVAFKLFMTGRHHRNSLCVFGENCNESVSFLNPAHRGIKYQKFYGKYTELDDEQDKERALHNFARWLHLDPKSTTLQDLASACPFYDRDTLPGRRALMSFIQSATTLFCTLNSCGSSFLRRSVGRSFGILLLDEGAQCTEAEFYIATTFPGIRRIVVVGDPQQLSATVIDPSCASAGYGVSWMGHVFENYSQKVHLLDTQYRMDPRILSFPNETFYANRIQSGVNVFHRLPHVVKPFGFIDLAQRGREEKAGYSWKNTFEANVIKSIICADPDIQRIRHGSVTSRIIVISPYRSQVHLLKELFRNTKGLKSVEVATVDSFQGQEGDVVILSTVRTTRVGFVDSAKRLNVALTRAKRVLRVVGDATFFESLHNLSTLRRLVTHAIQSSALKKTILKGVAWIPPNWKQNTLWTPVFTQIFQNNLSKMNEGLRYICLHTLKALVFPDPKALYSLPSRRTTPSWYMSALKGHEKTVRVVWVVNAKSMQIQAHFAGPHHLCLQFIQKNRNLPDGAGIMKRDFTGHQVDETIASSISRKKSILVWQMTNSLQNAIERAGILPHGNFRLDLEQNEVVKAIAPLMIESRSGTGKTNVLFQHALAHTLQTDTAAKPICFVTVSPRLAIELKCRFDEINQLEGGTLPKVYFYSFRQLLDALLQCAGIVSTSTSNVCRFFDFSSSRTSHKKLLVEESLVENEIGGVIMGSLCAAKESRSLTIDEYMIDKRSNVTIGSQEGKQTRKYIYELYLEYTGWKKESSRYDMNDIVLTLLNNELGCHFDCAYLDEVQDFSYAAIYLILCLAGREKLNWVCAGDTAQMISPGCSFTFDGLKQTMLAVRGGIESRLSIVHHLLRNYRTTKDVLLVGNEILRIAKSHFPTSIEYALPEIAMKDLGLKVVLCDWDSATKTKVCFGRNQALIYSSCSDSTTIHAWAQQWLGDHPLILTSLDSKGLEFDDVIIAFSFDRKVWDVARKRVESLRMLRELYVAVTRAKQRVVLLVRHDIDSMKIFMQSSINCQLEFMDASTILSEFNTETTSIEWFGKGQEYFRDGKYKIASGCFSASRDFGWAFQSAGLHEESLGQQVRALASYRRAARFFGDSKQYSSTLDLLAKVRDLGSWNHEDDELYNEARHNLPRHLNRVEIVKFALKMDAWNEITVSDLTGLNTTPLLMPYREYCFMKSLVSNCTERERWDIAEFFPSNVAQWYDDKKKPIDAVRLFLRAGEPRQAERVTENTTRAAADNSQRLNDLPVIVEIWTHSNLHPTLDGVTDLLIRTFETPRGVSQSCPDECMEVLGAQIVKLAVTTSLLEDLELHRFHKHVFHAEVILCLQHKFISKNIKIVQWFLDHDDRENATSFATKYVKSFTATELMLIIDRYDLRPGLLVIEIENKSILLDAAKVFLREENQEFELALQVCDLQLKNLKLSGKHADAIIAIWRSSKPLAQAVQYLQRYPRSKTAALWNLFSDPVDAGKNIADRCMQSFGKSVVQKAVLLGDQTKLKPLDFLHSFYKKAFCSLQHSGIIELYIQYSRRDLATSYAELHLRKWTDAEFMDIVWKQMIRPGGILREFLRRDMVTDSICLLVDEEQLDEAYTLSEMALSTQKQAESHAMTLITVWEQPAHLLRTASRLQPGSRHLLLRRFWYGAWNLLSTNEIEMVLKKLGPSVMRCVMKHPCPKIFMDSSMSEFVNFHADLQKLCRNRLKNLKAVPAVEKAILEPLADLSKSDGDTAFTPTKKEVNTPIDNKHNNKVSSHATQAAKSPAAKASEKAVSLANSSNKSRNNKKRGKKKKKKK